MFSLSRFQASISTEPQFLEVKIDAKAHWMNTQFDFLRILIFFFFSDSNETKARTPREEKNKTKIIWARTDKRSLIYHFMIFFLLFGKKKDKDLVFGQYLYEDLMDQLSFQFFVLKLKIYLNRIR